MNDSMEVVKSTKMTTKQIKKNKEKSTVKKDMLSNLSNEVIHHILSFVDAACAVRTSVLSKRWRNIWTSLPILNFNDWSFDNSIHFQCFVEHVLSCRNALCNVKKLKLVCHNELDDGEIIDSIIDYVAPMGIQVLNILAECVVNNLPQLFACRSLTKLKLAQITMEAIPYDFVSLEKLCLRDCRFECPMKVLLDPFRGCPNLRSLILHDCCYYGKFERFSIYAPELTELSISNMRVDERFYSDIVIELFTPKLHSFIYHDHSAVYKFSTKVNLPLVEKVDIHVENFEHNESPRADRLSLQLIELFELLGSAKFVSLSSSIINVLSMCPGELDGRSSPFIRAQNVQLNMDESTLFVIPTHVMAFLFGKFRMS